VPVQGAEAPVPEQLASSVVGSVGIGSVWEVGSVEVRYESQVSVQNRFDAFEEDDDEEDDDSSTAVWKQVGEEEWEMEPAVNLSPARQLQLMQLFGVAGIPDTQEEEMEEVDDYVESGDETIEDFGFGPESDEDDSPPPAPTATPTTGRANQTPPPTPTATPTTGRANHSIDRTNCDSHHGASERGPWSGERFHGSGPWSGERTERVSADRLHMRSMRKAKVYDINTVSAVSNSELKEPKHTPRGDRAVSRSVRWLEEAPKELNAIGDEQWTGPTSIRFNVANVQRPLAAASKVVEKGNRVVMEPGGGFIENIASGERIQLRIDRGVYVFDVKLSDGSPGVVALDSGVGVNVWPKTWSNEAKMEEKIRGLSMVAANGTEIENLGQKVIRFKAIKPFAGQLKR